VAAVVVEIQQAAQEHQAVETVLAVTVTAQQEQQILAAVVVVLVVELRVVHQTAVTAAQVSLSCVTQILEQLLLA
jgi:hypothetical protein